MFAKDFFKQFGNNFEKFGTNFGKFLKNDFLKIFSTKIFEKIFGKNVRRFKKKKLDI